MSFTIVFYENNKEVFTLNADDYVAKPIDTIAGIIINNSKLEVPMRKEIKILILTQFKALSVESEFEKIIVHDRVGSKREFTNVFLESVHYKPCGSVVYEFVV